MATRFYLPNTGATDVNPGVQGSWTVTTSFDRIKLVTAKISSAMATRSFAVANTSGVWQGRLYRQYIGNPLLAQTVSGTVKGQIRANENNNNVNANVALAAYIVSNDGTINRGQLFDTSSNESSAARPPELALNTNTNRAFRDNGGSAAITMASVDAQYGDRPLLEVGVSYNSSTTNNAIIVLGDDSGTDLAEDDTTTTANNPWVEFSQTLVFWTAGTDDRAQITSHWPVYSGTNFIKFATTTVGNPYDASSGHTPQYNFVVID
jgi:hypothetical protein